MNYVRRSARAAFVLLGLSVCQIALADSVVVTVGELDTAIEKLDANPDALERMVLEQIEQALVDADLQLDEGDLVFTDTSTDLIDDNSCNRTEVRNMTTNALLSSDTSLAFTLTSLNEPIQLDLNVVARINASGRAKQILGFRVSSCQELATDNFSFAASGEFDLQLSLRLVLNPILEASMKRLLLRPVVTLTGAVQSRNVRADVDDSILRSALRRVIEKQIDDAVDDSQLVKSLTKLQASLQRDLNEKMQDGVLTIELPEPDDEQVTRLYTLLSPEGDFSLSLGYLRTKRVELLGALITGDDDAVNTLVSNAALCQAAGLLQTSLPSPTVYRIGETGCSATDISQAGSSDVLGQPLYTDSQCQITFDYQNTSTNDFCNYALHNEKLGNADANPETLDRWTLSPGARFDIGALPLGSLVQPFTQRTKYKQVSTEQGECALEMRIHTVQPDALQSSVNSNGETQSSVQTLRPLIAFHGGSWQRRSSGALGIEALAAQFANKGFVVFAPFYRLIGTEEGTYACNNATLEQVLDDAHDAFDWVQANAERYGASGKPVVFGQSAGGHLSGVLAVERPDEVASAVLFYAPTDFKDFANQILNGQVNSTTGQRILETVVGQTLETLDVDAPLIRRNTLTERIVDEAIATPPFFVFHGMKDTVLPFRQSVRLCDALSGNPNTGPAATAIETLAADPFRRVVNCGFDGSELHLISEGEHAMDLCVAEELCLAGSPESAKVTADSMQRMLDWLGEMHAVESTVAANDDVNNATDVPALDGVSGDTEQSTDVIRPAALVANGTESSALIDGSNANVASKQSGSISLVWLLAMSVWLCVVKGISIRQRARV